MAPWARAAGFGLIGLLIAGLLALLGLGLTDREPVTGQSGVTRVGKPAPVFSLPLLGGGEFDLADHAGRPTVINFWSSWCPPCRVEAQRLRPRGGRKLRTACSSFGVDIQDDEQDATAYLRELGITYANGADRDGRVTVDYGVIGLPVTFFVSKDGVVERRWVGAIPEARLTAWVADLAAGVGSSDDREGRRSSIADPITAQLSEQPNRARQRRSTS